MDLMSGQREGDDARRAGRRALFECTKGSKESLTQFVARRDQQMTDAESHDIRMSDKMKGLMLEE
eukprot:8046243-Pyramimonas_sp.AAC.1